MGGASDEESGAKGETEGDGTGAKEKKKEGASDEESGAKGGTEGDDTGAKEKKKKGASDEESDAKEETEGDATGAKERKREPPMKKAVPKVEPKVMTPVPRKKRKLVS